MSVPQLPNFALPKTTDLTNEQVDKAGSGNFLDVEGRHALTVKTFEYRTVEGPDGTPILKTMDKDPTWYSAVATVETPEGKSKNIFLQIPTTKFTYGEKDSLIFFKKLRDFLSAFGIMLDISKADVTSQIIQTIFSNPEKMLINKPLAAVFHYPGAYLQPRGDNFVIINKGVEEKDASGMVNTYANRDAAKNAAEIKNIQLTFLEVKEFEIPANPTILIEGINTGNAVAANDDGLGF